MKKVIMPVAIFSVIMGLYAYNYSNSRIRKSDLYLRIIEALSQVETDNYWCCGTEGICVEASNIIIKGKLQAFPCNNN